LTSSHLIDIYRYMKTSVEIHDALLDDIRRVASNEGTTVRALIEEGLRILLARRRAGRAFRLRDASFDGDGLQPGVDWSWDSIRDLIYEGYGS